MSSIRRYLIVFACVVSLVVSVGVASGQTTFSTGQFSGAERAELRAANDWYKRCVKPNADVPKCGPTITTTAPPATTTVPATTTTTKPPATTTTTVPPTTTTTTTLPPPPPSGTMPTHENTGPNQPLTGPDITGQQWADSGVCDHQRVVGDVRIEDWSGNGGAYIWNANQCEFTGQVFILLDGNYSIDRYPTLNLSRVLMPNGLLLIGGIRANITGSEIGGAFWTPCPDCASTAWDLRRAMPITVTDTLIFSWPPTTPDGYHYEALHQMGSATGLSFNNVRFYIRGPMVSGVQTGAILFDADQATFTNVYFDYGGTPTAAYYTAYIGRGSDTAVGSVTINGCKIEQGMSWYIYPNGTANHNSVGATWSGCRDFFTDAPLTLGP